MNINNNNPEVRQMRTNETRTEERRPSQVSISQILAHLENGVTRTPQCNGYNSELRSLTEIYGVTKKEMNMWFRHPALKGKKTKKQFTARYTFVDDVTPDTPETTEEQ